MPDLMKLSHRQVEALLGLSRNSYNWIHGPSTDSTLKALRRMGLVNLSLDDSVAGYMFGSQPCWGITDAGKKRILAIQGTLTEEPEQQFNPSPCRHEPGKSDSDRLAKQLETIARLEKELEESEKRGSELAASYCDGVVGDEYGHTYCRYRVERDATLARQSTAIATAPTYQFQSREIGESDWTPCDFSRYLYCSKSPEMDTRVVEVTSQTSPAQAEQVEAERPAVVGYRSVESGMVYEQDYGLKNPEALTTVAECDSIVGELRAERDAALARVAELEGKLTDWVHEGFRLNEALAAAQTAHECTMGVGDGDGKLLVHGDHASIKAAQKIVIERDAALARIAELESKLAETQPYKQHPQIIGYARKKELAPLLDPSQPGGSYIYIGLDHPACWAEEPPYEFLTPLYTGPVTRHSAPEGYAIIPVRETEAMHDAVMALLYNGVARTDTQKLLDAYINAATNKESV